MIKLQDGDVIQIPDSATIVLGKVKDLTLIGNLPHVLKKEGFLDVEINYIGGSWV